MLQDLKYGFRLYRKTASLTVIAVLTLALGIGASTAVFSVVNAVLVKPLPYPHAGRIALPLRLVPPGLNLGYNEIPWGVPDFRVFSQSKAFQSVAAVKSDTFNLTGAGEPALLDGFRVSADFFRVLGVEPLMGRGFMTGDDQPGHEQEVILSYRLWRDRYGRRESVLGSATDLNGAPYTIVGVMAPDFSFPRGEEMPDVFSFPRRADLWVPLAAPAVTPPNEPADLAVICLLNPGVTLAKAQQEAHLFARREERQFPRLKGWFNSRVTPLNQQVVGGTRRPLLLLLAAVGVVLLIACSNVANLLLGRSVVRRREFSLRAAIGAGQGRLIRQMLTESLLLAAAGGIVGSMVAEAGIYFAKIFGPADIPRLQETSLDFRVFAFALALTLITAILLGVGPAVWTAGKDLVEPIKEGGPRSAGGAAASKLRDVLLVGQVAFALVLVVAAALLVQTFFRLLRVDAGFNASHVITFELSLSPVKYPTQDRMAAFYGKVLRDLRSLPVVESAGLVYTVPMDGATESGVIRILDHPVKDNRERPYSNYTIASPGYFTAVGTPVLRGRDFLDTDTSASTPVTIINHAMAEKYWYGLNPLGKLLGLGSAHFPPMTIIGIVADVKHISLREAPAPEMYVPYPQKPYPSMLTMHIVLRTPLTERAVMGSVRRALHSLDPELPLARVTTLQTIVSDSMKQSRFAMLLLAVFGALAIGLACIGIYGVISFGVVQRTREIGVRMALGAQPGDMFRMIILQGARLAGIGIAIGLLACFSAARILTGFLYGVRATDPLTFTAVSLLLIGVAIMACVLPARRATRIDPMIALRYE